MYCLVENGVVKDGPRDLPSSWLNMTGFDKCDTPEKFGWLPVADDAVPAFDAATQRLSESLAVNGQTVKRSFSVVALPDPITYWDVITLKVAFNHENRIRALEGKQAITAAQFKNAVKALASV